MSSPPWQVIAVLGPTATGKSAFAMALAADLAERGLNVELISADALQAYRGITIGTAKPGPRERTRVRHHLIDVIEPHQAFSAGAFARRAAVAVEEIEARGALPVLVGGSGFYLRALFEGLAPVPPVGAEVREALRADLRSHGLCRLVRELREVDPEGAETLAPGDTQRVLRALEVVRATGRPLTEWQRRGTEGRLDRRLLKVGLTLPRAVLYDAVEKRARRMLERGWLAEVERLRDTYLPEHARGRGGCSLGELPAFQAIGYRQLADHLDGNLTLEQALEETVQATRRYAKRQETWFRKESQVWWIDAAATGDPERARRRIVEALIDDRPFEAAP
ncbi:MAG: tRNA (adenosine(37)-N6)-dimethylallyltransferase MiaA [Acidobacteriota bacterium]|nr:tRNA (adenosine(37)-N6)-dimethylallyltransferase MiaA [Acidobacteriota bacterium]